MLSIKKSPLSWLSKLVIVVFITSIIAIIWVFRDKITAFPEAKTDQNTPISPVQLNSNNHLAKQLINKFIVTKLSSEEKNNRLQALNNSLQHLQDTHSEALPLLQKLKLKAAINYLIESISQEKKPRETAKTWVDIGNLQQLQSSQLALYAYKKASQLDDKNSNVWSWLGHFYRQKKQFTLSENAYNKVLESSSNSPKTQLTVFSYFGLLYQAQGKLEKAEESYLKALEISAQKENIASLASNNENLAILYKEKNSFKLSEKHYLQSLHFYEVLKQTNSIASVQIALASLYHQYKHFNKAEQYHKMALTIYQSNNQHKKIASSYHILGILSQQQGHLVKAKEFFSQSLEIHEKNNNQQGIANQYNHLAILDRLQKKFPSSENLHLKSLAIYQKLHYLEGISQQQINLGFLYQAWEQTKKACQLWSKSKQILVDIDNKNRLALINAIIEKNCKNNKVDKP